jgi:hypothetical protein
MSRGNGFLKRRGAPREKPPWRRESYWDGGLALPRLWQNAPPLAPPSMRGLGHLQGESFLAVTHRIRDAKRAEERRRV